ncbi:MAG: type VI secretion system tube protein Hcp [Gammaproteobacteria bacterium]|nr:type VI secretion system tube protein Hcp [Gammaproteobacteria bacterium]
MSVEMYLKMDEVTGESRNYSYKGWSDVLSWHWELLSNRGSPQAGDNGETSFGEISITKHIGTDSAAIMLLYAQGKIIQYADLNIIPTVGKREAKQKYLSMRMEDVLVKSIITGGNTSETHFNENIVLSFNRIRFEYNFHAASSPGEDDAGSVDYQFAWDIAQNKQWQ